MYNYVLTCGDINGIGPEICVKALNKINQKKYNKVFFLIPHNVFLSLTNLIKPNFSFDLIKKISEIGSNKIQILDLGKANLDIGMPTKSSGKFAYKAINKSYELISQGLAESVITAPISKSAFQLAGIAFPGHTELFAELSNTKKFGMMFLSDSFHAMLFTIHEPIKKISSMIKKKNLEEKIQLTLESLQNDLGIKNPKIAVLGLNPHAGENGRIGNEESVISKALIKFDDSVIGPLVPDAFFANKIYKNYDCTFGMYHDQVLIPFKLLNFDKGVNFTIGLPFVRTSPDHGTAFDIAWKNKANPQSIIESFKWADKILSNRKKLNVQSN